MSLRRSRKKAIQENIFAVCLALALSFVVYQIAQNSGILTADITGGPQPIFNEYSDVVVHQSANEILTIFVGKDMEDVMSMSFIFLFDPSEMVLEQDIFRSIYPLAYSAAGEGKGTIVLTDIGDIDVKDELLQLSVAGNADSLVVGDVIAGFADGTQASLTVQLPR